MVVVVVFSSPMGCSSILILIIYGSSHWYTLGVSCTDTTFKEKRIDI